MFAFCCESVSGIRRKKRLIVTVCALFVPMLLGGCYKPTDYPVIVDVPQTELKVRRSIVGASVENRPIECLVLGQGPDVTFVLAAIHGDEPAGVPLVRHLARYLKQNQQLLEGRKVVLLPVGNPDGMASNSRLNARGVDLNRNFAPTNRSDSQLRGTSALSEPEARVIEWLIRHHAPDRIVSIHQLTDTGPEALAGRLPKGCIDYDGPAKALADRLAEYSDLPVEKLGARSGSLGSYAGLTLGIPVITVELPLHVHQLDLETLWQRYGTLLIAVVVYPDKVR